jgi:hypothetical protein
VPELDALRMICQALIAQDEAGELDDELFGGVKPMKRNNPFSPAEKGLDASAPYLRKNYAPAGAPRASCWATPRSFGCVQRAVWWAVPGPPAPHVPTRPARRRRRASRDSRGMNRGGRTVGLGELGGSVLHAGTANLRAKAGPPSALQGPEAICHFAQNFA